MKTIDSIKETLAMSNTLQFGDTDIFPKPYEYDVLEKHPEAVWEIIREKTYQDQSNSLHLEVQKRRGGTRTATLIDPLLHLDYLSLAIEIAEAVECKRIPKADNIVHSYRFSPDQTTGKLFDPHYGFHSYSQACDEQISKFSGHCIVVDIQDFYPSISFETLDSALKTNDISPQKIENLKIILNKIGSKGLPVGGNASRIFAEILLNEIDKHLIAHGITFVRFVDDITIFTKNNEISDLLLIHQKMSKLGLKINYGKLRISEYSFNSFYNIFEKPSCSIEDDLFDDILDNAEDISSLIYNDEVGEVDVQQAEIILSRQIARKEGNKKLEASLLRWITTSATIDGFILNKRIASIETKITLATGLLRLITTPAKINGFSSGLADNFGHLYHSDFGRVANWMLQHSAVMSHQVIDKIHRSTMRLFDVGHSLVKSLENRAFAIRLLGLHKAKRAVGLLLFEYEHNNDPLIRSTIVHVFRKWGCADLLIKGYVNFQHLEMWERRAFIMAPETRGKLSNVKLSLLENILIKN
jgi:hypothetical protein